MYSAVLSVVFFSCVVLCGGAKKANFEVPTPKLEALYPKGFRVTLPDDGYSFFGFRGNINQEFTTLDEGEIKHDVVRPNNGQWVYKNRDIQLDVGDIIYYWIYVIKNGSGKMVTDLEWTVTELVNDNGTPHNSQPNTNKPDTNVPKPKPDSQTDDGLTNRFDPCVKSATMVQGRATVCKDELIFSEEFEVSSLGELKQWDPEVKFPLDPDFPFNMYTPDGTVSFAGGSLVITPLLTESQLHEGALQESLDLGGRCTGVAGSPECTRTPIASLIIPPVMTAKVTTRQKFSFKYGKIEVRAKLPEGNWIIPEINLESSENYYGSKNYESGLMRIAFARGNANLAKKLYGGPVLSHNEPFRSSLMKEKIGLDNWSRDYHNYTMVWKPDGIEVSVDDEVYGSINPGEGFYETARNNGVTHASHWLKGTVMAPLDHMFHLTLGIRVGGDHDFADNLPDKPWRNSASKGMINFWRNRQSWQPTWYNNAMKIDYVKVYAL